MTAPAASVAVIGGSRAYDLLKGERFGTETRKPKRIATPFGKSAPIHLFAGDGFSYYFLSRHGEAGYEVSAPYVNYRANIWGLKKLGTERIIAWSQPGAIDPRIGPGNFAVPHDLIDFTCIRPSNFFEGTGLGFIRMSDPFCPDIRAICASAIADCGLTVFDRAVYLCTDGPRLETPAEIRMFAGWGADLVGMTLTPEAFLARQLEICYAAICLSSNFAEGISPRSYREGELFEGMLSKEESEEVERSLGRLPLILRSTLRHVMSVPFSCKCSLAMERYRKMGLVKDLLNAARPRNGKGYFR